MRSSELLTFALNWLSQNNLSVVLLILSLIPILTILLAGYAIHVLRVIKEGK